MKILKKQGLGTWLSLLTIVLSVVGLILYNITVKAGAGLVIAGQGVFYDMTRAEDSAMASTVMLCTILALVFLVVAIVLDQFKFEGIVGKVCGFVVGALRIVVPALLVLVFLYFLYGSFTGLGWTFFSNEELSIEAEAVAAGKLAITTAIFFLLPMIVSIVASYCTMAKKEA